MAPEVCVCWEAWRRRKSHGLFVDSQRSNGTERPKPRTIQRPNFGLSSLERANLFWFLRTLANILCSASEKSSFIKSFKLRIPFYRLPIIALAYFSYTFGSVLSGSRPSRAWAWRFTRDKNFPDFR